MHPHRDEVAERGGERPDGVRDAEDAGIDLDANPDVVSVPLEGDDGREHVIAQQPSGPGVRIGQGEFPDPGTPPRDGADVAAEQAQRQAERPLGNDGDRP